MRDEGLYLQDIVEAADDLKAFLGGKDKAEFVSSALLTSAVLHKLLIIGEAAAHISQETRQRHPEIEWADVVGFRNYAIHAYFSVDIERVWAALRWRLLFFVTRWPKLSPLITQSKMRRNSDRAAYRPDAGDKCKSVILRY